jgi:hypothetical protein
MGCAEQGTLIRGGAGEAHVLQREGVPGRKN